MWTKRHSFSFHSLFWLPWLPQCYIPRYHRNGNAQRVHSTTASSSLLFYIYQLQPSILTNHTNVVNTQTLSPLLEIKAPFSIYPFQVCLGASQPYPLWHISKITDACFVRLICLLGPETFMPMYPFYCQRIANFCVCVCINWKPCGTKGEHWKRNIERGHFLKTKKTWGDVYKLIHSPSDSFELALSIQSEPWGSTKAGIQSTPINNTLYNSHKYCKISWGKF